MYVLIKSCEHLYMCFYILFLLWTKEAKGQRPLSYVTKSFLHIDKLHQIFVTFIQRDITPQLGLFLEIVPPHFCTFDTDYVGCVMSYLPHNLLSIKWNIWDLEGFFIYHFDSKI